MADGLTRRGLLGMFAAGAAAAVLPSGVIMPVRKILVPRRFDGLDDYLQVSMFQDAAGMNPVVLAGNHWEVWAWDAQHRQVKRDYIPYRDVLRQAAV